MPRVAEFDKKWGESLLRNAASALSSTLPGMVQPLFTLFPLAINIRLDHMTEMDPRLVVACLVL